METMQLPSGSDQPVPSAEHSANRACQHCGGDLTNKKLTAKFCSDKCRTAYGREQQRARIAFLLAAIQTAAAEIKTELEGPS